MKRIVFNIALLSAFSIVSAQNASDSTNTASATDTTIKRNIEVVRDYTPVIKEAGKINTMPELKDVNTKKIDVDYKVWTSTYKPKTDIIPSLDYALLEPDIFVKNFGKGESFGLSVDYDKHIYRTGVLQLSEFVKLI